MDEIDPQSLRRAFGSFMTGVTVVTTRAADGQYVGFTANSFASVSLDPPLLLVCPGRHLTSFDVFSTVEHFAVSVLAEGQEGVSNVFAKAGDDRFAQVPWHLDQQGSPLIDGACAAFSCRTYQRHVAGDHLILIGEVVSVENAGRRGLGYGSGGYFSLERERQSEVVGRPGQQGVAGAFVEHEGCLLIQRDAAGCRLPAIDVTNAIGPRSALEAYFRAIGMSLALGPVYSVYDHGSCNKRTTFFRARAQSAETAGLGRFEPIDTLRPDDMTDPAQTSMLRRFQAEYRNRDFGLYLGTHESGEIHLSSDIED